MNFLFIVPLWIINHVHPLLAWVLLIIYFSFLVSLVIAPVAFISEALDKFERKK